MNVIQIRKGGNRRLTTNFVESEFQSTSWDAPEVYDLSKNTVDALQFIRSYYGPIIPTSIGRTPAHNSSIGSDDSSMHLITDSRPVRAIDFKFVDPAHQEEFQNDVAAKGAMWNQLRSIYGLTIGLYDNFTHIDDGGGAGVSQRSLFTDKHGTYGFWDLRGKKKSLIDQITGTFDNNTDGFQDWPKTKWALIILLMLALASGGFFLYQKLKS